MKKAKGNNLFDCYKSVPHFDLIVKDGYIEIPSIFMFEGGQEEYYSFLHACKQLNCTVRFVNENIIKKPSESSAYEQITEALYLQIAQSQQMIKEYINYLIHKDEMSWDKVTTCSDFN